MFVVSKCIWLLIPSFRIAFSIVVDCASFVKDRGLVVDEGGVVGMAVLVINVPVVGFIEFCVDGAVLVIFAVDVRNVVIVLMGVVLVVIGVLGVIVVITELKGVAILEVDRSKLVGVVLVPVGCVGDMIVNDCFKVMSDLTVDVLLVGDVLSDGDVALLCVDKDGNVRFKAKDVVLTDGVLAMKRGNGIFIPNELSFDIS